MIEHGRDATRLEFAAFYVKNDSMAEWGDSYMKSRRGTYLVLAMACLWMVVPIGPVSAQLFSDRPPPVPPALVPAPPSSPAISLAPPSGPAAAPNLPGPLLQPPVAAIGPAPSLQAPAQGVLALTARYGKDLPVINGGLVWRIFSDKPDETGAFKLVREDRGATPNIPLPPGNYVVHVALGMVSAARPVTVKTDTDRESFLLPAGGLRIEGRVGTSKIPQNQISFSIHKGSQFDSGGESPAIVPNVTPGDVVMLPEGTYNIISNYGDANSVVRSDIQVQAGKLTDTTITHRAAVITLKLVGEKGGEALANTAWSVITPGGDVVKESIGAFPRVILAEGEYRAIAKNEGKVFERTFNVVNGVDGDVEVLAR